MRAGIRLRKIDLDSCPCCLSRSLLGEEGQEYTVFGPAGTSSVQWPKQESVDNKLAIIIGSSVGACVLIFASILIGVVIVAMVMRKRHKRHVSKDSESLLHDTVRL